MKRGKKVLSLKRRLFLVLLSVSVIPVVIITTFASIGTYNTIYTDTIRMNTEGMNWTQEQLKGFATELKELYYAMEFDQEFKEALLREHAGVGTYQDSSLIRDMLLAKLNITRALSYFTIALGGQQKEIYADRAQVTIRDRTSPILLRDESLQTNLFFVRSSDDILAVHSIHRFPDRELIAQQSAAIRREYFDRILSTLQIYENEMILITNDAGQEILRLPEDASLSLDSLDDTSFELINEVNYSQQEGMLIFSTSDRQEPLTITKAIPNSEITASILPTIYTGVFLGLASLIVSVIISAILSSVISKPITSLATRVKNIELEHLVLEQEEEPADEVKVLEDHIALFVERIRELIRNEYDITLQSKQAQIHALQAQINPHFLHNTLQLIGSISIARGSDEVYRISHALSGMMRYAMDFSEPYVPLKEELQHLENYLYIQKERFSDRMSIQFTIDENVREALIPKLLLQPLVENAFVHGFESSSGPWRLSITAYGDEEDMLHILVRDNGCGMNPQEVGRLNEQFASVKRGALIGSVQSADHIGLANVNERLRLSSGEGAGVRITSEQGAWTLVELICNLRRSEG